MDEAYTKHSSHARRSKTRSSTNLNHLSLAPLTSKLPLDADADEIFESPQQLSNPPPRRHATTSYLQGRSAPTTPGLLSRSPPSRSRSRTRGSYVSVSAAAAAAAAAAGGTIHICFCYNGGAVPKSKSTTHLSSRSRGAGTASPRHHHHSHSHHHNHHHRRKGKDKDREDGEAFSARDRNDSDWLLRAGALLSSEARESKGQAWLVSRASSTSLTGLHGEEEGGDGIDDEAEAGYFDAADADAALNWELAAAAATAGSSRRGSLAPLDGDRSMASPSGSRFGSRSHSRKGSRSAAALTPAERRSGEGGYFGGEQQAGEERYIPGPDFVNLDEKLEAIERDTSQEDEAHVRKLVKRGQAGGDSWLGNVLGWSLFSVEEQEDEEEGEEEEEDGADEGDSFEGDGGDGDGDDGGAESRGVGARQDLSTMAAENIPPPKADEGGWQDAAWLLGVASKVLL